MREQKPKIALSSSVKNKLDSLKVHSGETYESIISSLIVSRSPDLPQLPGSNTKIVGAGSGDAAFNMFSHTMGWIADTQKKLPAGGNYEVTPEMRETAFALDPLVSGIITPFLKNVLLGGYDIMTADNKKYSAMIKELKSYISELEIMEMFRDDFEDYGIKHGHSYRRKDYVRNGLDRLQQLNASSMKTYEDPWDSSIVAYHQRIYAADTWSSVQPSSMKESNSWFIPDGRKFIESEGIEEEGAKEIWEYYRKKYNINETSGLRVDNTDKIIAMHKVRPGKPAPIDAAILAIWEKRLVIANSPNLIYSVLMPFMHLKKGVMLETTNAEGQKELITSIPSQPPADMATTDPEKYAVLNANYESYMTSLRTDAKNLMRYRAEGGLFASGPDTDLLVKESANSISPGFIQTMISQLNEDIGQALGFPVSLIMARGAELATTRTIQELFNTVYAGSRMEYEKIAEKLIRERFEGQSWDYKITLKDGTEEAGTFTFDETEAEFKLADGNVKDQLQVAQTELATMQMLQIAKALGASKPDIQALADERGFGLLDFDKFDTAGAVPGMFGSPGGEPPEELEVEEEVPEESTTIESAKAGLPPTQNEPPQAEKLKQELLTAYQEAQKAMEEILT